MSLALDVKFGSSERIRQIMPTSKTSFGKTSMILCERKTKSNSRLAESLSLSFAMGLRY